MIIEHKKTSDYLWKIRNEYVSLLTDFEDLEITDIRNKRDGLQTRTAEIYTNAPRTDKKSYVEAQNALQNEEEQTFNKGEVEKLLPIADD